MDNDATTKPGFTFDLGASVTIVASSERGEVVGRAQYAASEDSYFVRYKAADGRAVEAWWAASALS